MADILPENLPGVWSGEEATALALVTGLSAKARTILPWARVRDAIEGGAGRAGAEAGSCMMVIATDAPLSPRNLERLARRAVLGLGRTGGFMSNGSGDFVVAFSTAYRLPADGRAPASRELLPNASTSPLFLAAVESVEEAIYNSLTTATSVRGRDGHEAEAIPVGQLRALFEGARR